MFKRKITSLSKFTTPIPAGELHATPGGLSAGAAVQHARPMGRKAGNVQPRSCPQAPATQCPSAGLEGLLSMGFSSDGIAGEQLQVTTNRRRRNHWRRWCHMLINGIGVNNTAGPTSFTGVSQCPLLDLHGKGFAQQAVRFHGLDPCGPPIVSLQFRAKPGPLGTMPSRPCPAHTGTHHMLQATDSRSLKALEPRVDQREASEATRKDPQLMSVLVFFWSVFSYIRTEKLRKRTLFTQWGILESLVISPIIDCLVLHMLVCHPK